MTAKTRKYIYAGAVVLASLFGMNRCTVACNRASELEKTKKYSTEYVDSVKGVLASRQASLDSLYVVNRLLEQDTAYLRKELRTLGMTNKALLEQERTMKVHIKTN